MLTLNLSLYLYVLILAAFTGYEMISRVPSLLHTPLMSGTNFIHGIVLVGSIIVLAQASSAPERLIGFFAVFVATLNVVGGYWVTVRMLEMFKKDENKT